MMKTAFIFPGQGAQYIGMAKDFYEQVSESREVFELATKILGFDMERLCFEENENLNKTEYTQAAMLTASISILKAVEKEGLSPDITAGLSLGEYSTLVLNGTLEFEDALRIVRKRGHFMENEVPSGVGSMSAVLGLEKEIIEDICIQVSKDTKMPVEPANYNCPGQIVISGEKDALIEANRRLIEAGAKRVLSLKVSGPFHSSMLKGAGEKLEKELQLVKLHKMKIPYVSNVTAEIVTNEVDTNEIKDLLKRQVYSPVKWQQSVETLIKNGVDTFIEIGPGRTLSSFIRKIDRTKTVINIENMNDIEKLRTL
jgi:[acyl-carrier-protein] S-malonyltransferase